MPGVLLYHRCMPWVLFLIGILPVFFLPFTQDYYDTNKWMLLAAAGLITVTLASWQFAKSSRLTVSFFPSLIGTGSLALASLIGLLFVSSNKAEAVLHPFGFVTFLVMVLITVFWAGSWSHERSRYLLWSVLAGVSLLGIITVYQFFGVGKFMFPGVPYLGDPLWSPTGSALATFSLFLITLPLLIQGILEAHKHKRERYAATLIIVTIIVGTAAALMLWQLAGMLGRSLLSIPNGWVVMLEILKAPKQALAGVGVENFLTAFSASRPVSLNLTPLWDARYTVSTNFPFHFTTVYGLIGTIATLLLLKSALVHRAKSPVFISLVIAIAVLLLTPPNLSVLIVLFLLLLIADHRHEPKKYTLRTPAWLGWSIFVLVIAGSSFTIYSLTRYYLSEVAFARSLATAKSGDGTATYNLQIRAIGLNGAIPRYHITYSQTSLALATSVARSITTDATMTEEDKTKNRQLVAELIQQSIREGKLAISLNPNSVFAWENLARIYRQLIGVAAGADQWAITTYTQAIRLDPTNPLLSLELGGVYVQMKNYTDAITQFTRATNLKPDYANAWYNLANAYGLTGDTASRIKTLEKTQTLVDPSSNEYRIITEELDETRNPKVKQKTDDAQTKTPEDSVLTTPTPAPILVPPLEVPNP